MAGSAAVIPCLGRSIDAASRGSSDSVTSRTNSISCIDFA
jgi:hypothetical protein